MKNEHIQKKLISVPAEIGDSLLRVAGRLQAELGRRVTVQEIVLQALQRFVEEEAAKAEAAKTEKES